MLLVKKIEANLKYFILSGERITLHTEFPFEHHQHSTLRIERALPYAQLETFSIPAKLDVLTDKAFRPNKYVYRMKTLSKIFFFCERCI